MEPARKIRAYANLRVAFRSRKQMEAIAEALRPELAHPAREKARARVTTRGRILNLSFETKDSTTLRAILSSYLRMLAASLNVCNTLLQIERLARESAKNRDL